MENNLLKCKQCGKCCRELGKHYKDTTFTTDGVTITIKNGKCIHLTKDNKCGIQDIKPRWCKNYFCDKCKNETFK